MKCEYPITVKSSSKWHRTRWINVPCGKCPSCVKNYQTSWSVRLFFELRSFSVSSFVTLTYRNETIPLVVDKNTGECHNSLNKRDIQLWIKRLRKSISKPFKYFCCGEYGPSTKRAHYHLLFFGLSPIDLLDPLLDWKLRFGNYDVQKVDLSNQKSLINSSRYVAKYTNKGPFEVAKVTQKIVDPPFRIMSKGIGIDYVLKNKNFHLAKNKNFNNSYERFNFLYSNNNIIIGNFVHTLPRYYYNKIFGSGTRLSCSLQDFSLKMSDDLYLQKLDSLQTSLPIHEAVSALALQDLSDQKYFNYETRLNFAKFYNFKKF